MIEVLVQKLLGVSMRIAPDFSLVKTDTYVSPSLRSPPAKAGGERRDEGFSCLVTRLKPGAILILDVLFQFMNNPG